MDCCQKQQENKTQDKASLAKQDSFGFIKNKIFIYCFLGISGALVAVYIFKVPISNLFIFGFLLLCPLMHIFMMKGHSMKSEHENSQKSEEKELKD